MEKTALQLLWEWVDEKYPNFNKADIEEKIKELLPADRDAIVEAAAYGNGRASVDDKKELGEQYYRTKYGETYH